MPRRYHRHSPGVEQGEIPSPGRVAHAEQPLTPIPHPKNYSSLREAARSCTACPLYKRGTQTVFGEGSLSASLLFVGEQPGDQEDLRGEPFVGPAGKLLDQALEAAGISRSDVYLTNAVKHFKWIPRGKRRLHQKPNAGEVRACRPWLEQEVALVKPQVIVALGATAAQSVVGKAVKVMSERGHVVPAGWDAKVFITIHPSAILRIPDTAERHEAFDAFVRDLKKAARLAG